MVDEATLRSNAVAKLEDARVLYNQQRYDGAAYLCGYAVEFVLKASICNTLNVTNYPDNLVSFKTHKLETLLLLSGKRGYIRQVALADWTFVAQNWDPEMRYQPTGTVPPTKVQSLIQATDALLRLL